MNDALAYISDRQALHASNRAAEEEVARLYAELDRLQRDRTEVGLVLQGVTIPDPGDTWIGEMAERRRVLDEEIAALRSRLPDVLRGIEEANARLSEGATQAPVTPGALKKHYQAIRALQARLDALRERHAAIESGLSDAASPLPELWARRDALAASVEMGEASADDVAAIDGEIAPAHDAHHARALETGSVLAGLTRMIEGAERDLADLTAQGDALVNAYLARQLGKAADAYQDLASRTCAALQRAAGLHRLLQWREAVTPGLPRADWTALHGAFLPSLKAQDASVLEPLRDLSSDRLDQAIRGELDALKEAGVPLR